MKIMLLCSGLGAVAGFIVIGMLFDATAHWRERVLLEVLYVFGALPGAAVGALIGAVNVLQKELRETRRELKHWQSIQQMDEDLSMPSTHIKPGPPSGRS